MWNKWFDSHSYYSHGPLVPLIAGFLIYQKKQILSNVEIKASRTGLYTFAAGIVMHILGALLQVHFISAFSIIPVLFGLLLYFYGYPCFKIILFPLSFLAFCIPLPSVIVVNMSFELKLLSAKLAALTLNHLGVPALQEGSMIRLRHTCILVEDVCSGLRSLISLLAVGSLFAYWLRSNHTRKIILFLLAAPVAMTANTFRIVLLSMCAEIYGPSYASGAFHNLSGFLALTLAVYLLYLCGKLLE